MGAAIAAVTPRAGARLRIVCRMDDLAALRAPGRRLCSTLPHAPAPRVSALRVESSAEPEPRRPTPAAARRVGPLERRVDGAGRALAAPQGSWAKLRGRSGPLKLPSRRNEREKIEAHDSRDARLGGAGAAKHE